MKENPIGDDMFSLYVWFLVFLCGKDSFLYMANTLFVPWEVLMLNHKYKYIIV